MGEGEASAVLLQSVPAQARAAFVPAVKLSLVWGPQERSMSLGQLPPAGGHAAEGPGLRVPAVVGAGGWEHVLKSGGDPTASFLAFGQSLRFKSDQDLPCLASQPGRRQPLVSGHAPSRPPAPASPPPHPRTLGCASNCPVKSASLSSP